MLEKFDRLYPRAAADILFLVLPTWYENGARYTPKPLGKLPCLATCRIGTSVGVYLCDVMP